MYFGALTVMSLAQTSGSRFDFVILATLFIPAGALIVLALGTDRLPLAIFIGLLGVLWIELACMVFNSSHEARLGDMAARALGIAAGVAIVSLAHSLAGLRERPHNSAFTRLSQARHPQLRAERRHDRA